MARRPATISGRPERRAEVSKPTGAREAVLALAKLGMPAAKIAIRIGISRQRVYKIAGEELRAQADAALASIHKLADEELKKKR